MPALVILWKKCSVDDQPSDQALQRLNLPPADIIGLPVIPFRQPVVRGLVAEVHLDRICVNILHPAGPIRNSS